jgi:membrane protein implicated in regulation of membrane protease activity
MPMKGSPFKGAVIFRYAVLQVLGLVVFVVALLFIRNWFPVFPLWLFWILVVVWIAKDVALYPLVWKSYDTQGGRDPGPAVGATGVAKQRLEPSGYIEVGGELWKAEIAQGTGAVEPGQRVTVTGRKGLTLSVEPLDHPG